MTGFRTVKGRGLGAVLGVVAAVALGFAAFLITREIAADGPAQANPGERPTTVPGQTETPEPGAETPPGEDVTPEPGATPDTSQPYWFVPYGNAERLAPKYDQVVAGIEVGPDVQRQTEPCQGEVIHADFDAGNGSPVSQELGYMPEGTVRQAPTAGTGVTVCDGVPRSSWADYSIPPDPAALDLVRSGEKTWFEVQHGATFSIGRKVAGPAWENAAIPAERWHEVEIDGHPAAAAGPIIAEGWGVSAVYFHADGVMTVIQAQNLTLGEVIAIAEGLVQ